MLRSIAVRDFTVFHQATFRFSEGVNVILGENGLGKTHVLKLGYTGAWISYEAGLPRGASDKTKLQRRIAEKLEAVFQSESIGRLVRRTPGRPRAQVAVDFAQGDEATIDFSFSATSKTDVVLDEAPSDFMRAPAVFFPTKEVISMFPGFAAIYRDYHIEIDETYYDLCLALERPLLRGARETTVRRLLRPLEEILEGKVFSESGRFYLDLPDQGTIEMPLVAEGIRKLASVAYLVANGTLRPQATLFWDEPEANLNPKLIRKLAAILVQMARAGIQVILATHNLFLLREMSLLLSSRRHGDVPSAFFALDRRPRGGGVRVNRGESIEDIEPIAALDAELEQSDELMSDQ